ncbi:MAG: hypothetical protein M1836_006006 [Candelina mexicana]|nr:MAG: hypothetical protein M1836_006006 [Candelina mexicana]
MENLVLLILKLVRALRADYAPSTKGAIFLKLEQVTTLSRWIMLAKQAHHVLTPLLRNKLLAEPIIIAGKGIALPGMPNPSVQQQPELPVSHTGREDVEDLTVIPDAEEARLPKFEYLKTMLSEENLELYKSLTMLAAGGSASATADNTMNHIPSDDEDEQPLSPSALTLMTGHTQEDKAEFEDIQRWLDRPSNKGIALDQARIDLRIPSDEEILHIPGTMTSHKLYEHRVTGVPWLRHVALSPLRSGILADDMGLGKTDQSICFIHVMTTMRLEYISQQERDFPDQHSSSCVQLL